MYIFSHSFTFNVFEQYVWRNSGFSISHDCSLKSMSNWVWWRARCRDATHFPLVSRCVFSCAYSFHSTEESSLWYRFSIEMSSYWMFCSVSLLHPFMGHYPVVFNHFSFRIGCIYISALASLCSLFCAFRIVLCIIGAYQHPSLLFTACQLTLRATTWESKELLILKLW